MSFPLRRKLKTSAEVRQCQTLFLCQGTDKLYGDTEVLRQQNVSMLAKACACAGIGRG